jgi:hypothetical protein
LINRSVREAVRVIGGCGVGTTFFGAAFLTTGGFGFGADGFWMTGGTGFLVTGGAGFLVVGGIGTVLDLPPLPFRPSIIILPSWV